MKLRLAAPLLAVLLAACASSTGGQHLSNHSSRQVLTADEIAQSHESNVYAAIETLRPNMLANRGPTSVNNNDPGIVVFLNGQRYGDVNSLKLMSTNDVLEIRSLSAGEAQYRYGTGFPEGVIEVKTRTQ